MERTSSSLVRRTNLVRREAFDPTGGARERQPRGHEVSRSSHHEEGQRHRDPDTRALEAIHQLAPRAAPETRAEIRKHVSGAVFQRQKMGRSTGRERSEGEPRPEPDVYGGANREITPRP